MPKAAQKEQGRIRPKKWGGGRKIKGWGKTVKREGGGRDIES